MPITTRQPQGSRRFAAAPDSAIPCSIPELLECLSECEWALTEAVNRDQTGWLQETARDSARAMLQKWATPPDSHVR